MVKCCNLSRKDLCRIGTQVADAFLAEPGAFSVLSPESAAKLFTLVMETCYQTGHLLYHQ